MLTIPIDRWTSAELLEALSRVSDPDFERRVQVLHMVLAELRGRLEALVGMSYENYLQTSHWKTKRLLALKRAEFKCQFCGLSGGLDVHHRTYERRGHERMGDLVVLCRSCHHTFHKYSIGPILRELTRPDTDRTHSDQREVDK